MLHFPKNKRLKLFPFTQNLSSEFCFQMWTKNRENEAKNGSCWLFIYSLLGISAHMSWEE